jgi:MEMO1 family protein
LKDVLLTGLFLPHQRHAGYTYSGPCAAWAYKSLDLKQAKRVFLLGPSHTYGLSDCAVTSFSKYATPFGDLAVDEKVVEELRAKGFPYIWENGDRAEHSLELHLPYIYKRLSQTFDSPSKFPTLIPILVGSNDREKEKRYGDILYQYLKDPENAFVVSSDFCHWGDHFDYMVYSADLDIRKLQSLSRYRPAPDGPPIHEAIKVIDQSAMDAIETGSHDKYVDNLKTTKNTVCGRHPIGVMMAALERMAKETGDEAKYKFKMIKYDRSSLVKSPRETSVSYVAAYAVA